jgi:hypothetical protein
MAGQVVPPGGSTHPKVITGISARNPHVRATRKGEQPRVWGLRGRQLQARHSTGGVCIVPREGVAPQRVGAGRRGRRLPGRRRRRRRRLELHHKGIGPLGAACQKEDLSKAGRRPLGPIPAIAIRVSHVQGARCAERHLKWHARGVWRAAPERGAVGAAEAPANFLFKPNCGARDRRGYVRRLPGPIIGAGARRLTGPVIGAGARAVLR